MPPDDDRAERLVPQVAWPTLALALAAAVAWAGSAWAAQAALWPPWATVLLSTAAAFVAFTPLHDATHRSVARARTVNEVVGRLSAAVLAAPFPAFRTVHLEHHRNTNDPERDPDYWSGQGPAWLRPLRWGTQDLHYYVWIGRRWATQPKAVRVEVVAFLALKLAGIALAVALGHGVLLACAWLVPARLALVALAFSFDYLPHRPHVVLARDDPYRATHLLPSPLLTPLFLYQNFHLIHHLYPGIPFYRYSAVWRRERVELLRRGASERFAWLAGPTHTT